ncbi:MAG: hypothetical protein ACLFUV_07675 [Methanomassiliicoccales archaeon]
MIDDVLGEMDHRTSVQPRLSREGGNGGHDGPKVDFWEVLEGWSPENARLPRGAMAEELSDFLVLRGFPAANGTGPDCRVGGRTPVELVRGTEPSASSCSWRR